MSVQDDVKASLDKLFSTVITDDLAIARPAADGYLTNVVTVLSNPATQNTAQAIGTLATSSIAFEEQFLTTLGPQMGAVAAKDAAASVKALIDLEADKLTNQLAGSTASTAAVAVAASNASSAQAAGSQGAVF
jgi:hypothetical protein